MSFTIGEHLSMNLGFNYASKLLNMIILNFLLVHKIELFR